jgi:hypothetical protein
LLERVPFDQLHCDGGCIDLLDDIENRDDIGVFQAPRGTGLAHHAFS